MPDELDTLEESHTDAEIAFNRAEHAHRIATTRTYRSDDARTVAVREADEDLVAAATTLSQASDALDAGVRTTRTDLADVDSVATWADDAKVDFRRYWQVEAKEASLADLKQSIRIALRKDSLPKLAVITQAITRRLGDQPAGTFGERGYNRPKDGPDAAVRRDLQDLLAKAKAKLALTPDPEIVERLDTLRDDASKASKRAKDRLPRKRYAFERDDDRVRETAE